MHHASTSAPGSLGLLALCALAPLSACSWASFDDFTNSAPIRVHERPSNYGLPGYGKVLVGYQATIDGKRVSRFVASAGSKTPIAFSRAWTGDAVSEKAASLYCRKSNECTQGSDVGATLIPFEVWAADTPAERRGCVFAPSSATQPEAGESRAGGEGFVLCETHKPTQNFALGPLLIDAREEGSSLIFSGHGLPPGHPLGIAVFGAFAQDDRTRKPKNGALYAQPQRTEAAPPSELIPLIDPTTKAAFSDDDEAGDFGRSVVGHVDDAGELLIAVSQPSKQRVIVASYDDSAAGPPTERFRVRACIEAPSADLSGFGERLLLGDVTGDGEPELFIGNDPVLGAQPGESALFMFEGRSLPDVASGDDCPPWNAAAVAIECEDHDGASCAGSSFGAALAVGDVDGDGSGDLLIGAPLADVSGVEKAGAVWVLPGGSAGLDDERTTALSVGPTKDARFGASLTTLRTKDRDEPVIGAPGSEEIFVLMCTPVESGFGGSSLCLPR